VNVTADIKSVDLLFLIPRAEHVMFARTFRTLCWVVGRALDSNTGRLTSRLPASATNEPRRLRQTCFGSARYGKVPFRCNAHNGAEYTTGSFHNMHNTNACMLKTKHRYAWQWIKRVSLSFLQSASPRCPQPSPRDVDGRRQPRQCHRTVWLRVPAGSLSSQVVW